MSRHIGLAFLILCSAELVQAQPQVATSEQDFLSEMPVVLSVSRLPQRLDETPGAVTVLDRTMIRLSGARDVADLLLLVPGFQTSTAFESDAPQASYHGGFTNYSGRIQVLVDGRSAYSPYLFGSVAPGLQSVAIADIERIEVLRGSNSASYGARAFLGVINIVTRDPVDTLGVRVNVANGENGVRDVQASVGWAMEAGHFRLGVDKRGDG
jgi:iron complex outermembrane recepter protein